MIADRGSIGKVYWTTRSVSFLVQNSDVIEGLRRRRETPGDASPSSLPLSALALDGATLRHGATDPLPRRFVTPFLLLCLNIHVSSFSLSLSFAFWRRLSVALGYESGWQDPIYIYIYIYAITEEVLSFIDPNCILNNINFYTNILILTIDVQN